MPNVSLHLVREIMNMIRLRSNGDTTMHLALAGKGHLVIFKYIAETHFAGVVALGEVHVAVDNDDHPSTLVKNTALRCVVRHYLKTLSSYERLDPNVMLLSFIPENITKVVLGIVDVQMLNLLPNIETLVVNHHNDFFDYVKMGALNLKSLSCLTLKLGRWLSREIGIFGMPSFPPDNMLRRVKHLQIEVKLYFLMVDGLLTYISVLLHLFTAVETSTLLIQYYDNKIPPNSLIHNPKKFINWLGKLEVHGSFTLNYHEKYLCKNIRNRNLAEVKEKVKSAGFVETYEENKFVMVRTFHSAKLVYNVVLDFLAK